MTGNNDQDATTGGSVRGGSETRADLRRSTIAAARRVDALAPGTILGRYQIQECIDNGGMGVVYRARHTALGKNVALKVVSTKLQSEPRAIERFLREMQAVGRLEPHPHVLNAYDAGEENGVQYIATELIEGIQLATLIGHIGPLAVSEACKIISQAARALDHLRKHELVHRDIKPSNLMLTRDGVVKVVDMGLALLRDEQSEQITMFGETMGSVDYMAPEQWHDCHNVDWRSDVYALGCTFYCLLAGRPPYSDQPHSSVAKMRAHLDSPFPDIREKRSDVPREAYELLQSLVIKDPETRQTDLNHVAQELDRIACGDLRGLVERGFAEHAKAQSHAGHLVTHRTPGHLYIENDSGGADANAVTLPLSAAAVAEQAPVSPTARSHRVAIAFALLMAGLAIALIAIAFPHWQRGPQDPQPALSEAGVLDGSGETAVLPSPLVNVVGEAISCVGHDGNVFDIVFLQTENQLASVGNDGQLCVFDLNQPSEPLWSLQVSDLAAHSLSYDPKTESLTIACEDGSIQFCSLSERKITNKQVLMTVGFTGLAPLGDGPVVASSDWNGDVRQIDPTATPMINEVIGNRDQAVFDVDVSADGRYLAWSGREPRITLHELDSGLSKDLLGHDKWVYDVAISPDGKILASAGHEGKVRLWQIPDGQPLGQIESLVPQAVCFFPDSRHLAIGGRNSRVVIHDLQSDRPPVELSVGNHIDCVRVSDDARWLAAGANDGALKVWRLDVSVN